MRIWRIGFALAMALVPSGMSFADSSGELLLWGAGNQYAMTDFNNWLHGIPSPGLPGSSSYNWTPSDPYLTEGLGAGAEYALRWGRWISTGFNVSFEVLFASVSRDLKSANCPHYPAVSGSEMFDLNLGKGMIGYSGALPLLRWLAFEWDADGGLATLITAQNHVSVAKTGMVCDMEQFKAGPAKAWEISGGPTFVLSAAKGWLLSLRAGYRSLMVGPFHSLKLFTGAPQPWAPIDRSTWSFDYSGLFFRLEIGGGSVGNHSWFPAGARS